MSTTIEISLDAIADEIVAAALAGESRESMADYGWTIGTENEFAGFWIEGAAGDLIRKEARAYGVDADDLECLVRQGLANAYDPDSHDAPDEERSSSDFETFRTQVQATVWTDGERRLRGVQLVEIATEIGEFSEFLDSWERGGAEPSPAWWSTAGQARHDVRVDLARLVLSDEDNDEFSEIVCNQERSGEDFEAATAHLVELVERIRERDDAPANTIDYSCG
jgi:hypothetical protein